MFPDVGLRDDISADDSWFLNINNAEIDMKSTPEPVNIWMTLTLLAYAWPHMTLIWHVTLPPLLIPLWSLFNKCFDWGIIPSVWQEAIISPIPKCSTKDKFIPLNYRGSSLLSNVYKLYSSILNHRLVAYLDNVDFLTEEQNGFRKHRSCEDHAFVLSSVISSRMDQNKHTFVAFIDFAKAFDWVDRELLLYKLLRSSVDGPFYFAIKSMYTKTRSSVKVNDDLSNWFETECGVRQGDVLSPTLFNIFINDLSTELNSLRIGITLGYDRISHLLYADDLTLMAENENDLQTLINCVENWCNKWRMSVNHLKSKIVHFRKVRVSITDFSFTFQNKTVDIVHKYKYLGLILEEHLDFKASINELCSKGGRALGAWISKFKTLKDVGYITYIKNCLIVLLYPLLTILLVSGVILSMMIALNYKTVRWGIF